MALTNAASGRSRAAQSAIHEATPNALVNIHQTTCPVSPLHIRYSNPSHCLRRSRQSNLVCASVVQALKETEKGRCQARAMAVEISDSELYLRWLQYCSTSTFFTHLHITCKCPNARLLRSRCSSQITYNSPLIIKHSTPRSSPLLTAVVCGRHARPQRPPRTSSLPVERCSIHTRGTTRTLVINRPKLCTHVPLNTIPFTYYLLHKSGSSRHESSFTLQTNKLLYPQAKPIVPPNLPICRQQTK